MQTVYPSLMTKRARRIAALNAKAHDRGLIGDLTEIQWVATLKHFNYRCAYCGIGHLRLTVDHYIPQNSGGPTSVSNLIPSCENCNHRKGGQLPRHCSWIPHESMAKIHAYLGPLVLAHYQQQFTNQEVGA